MPTDLQYLYLRYQQHMEHLLDISTYTSSVKYPWIHCYQKTGASSTLDRNLLQCVAAFVGHDSGAFSQTLPRPIHYLDPLGRRVDIGFNFPRVRSDPDPRTRTGTKYSTRLLSRCLTRFETNKKRLGLGDITTQLLRTV